MPSEQVHDLFHFWGTLQSLERIQILEGQEPCFILEYFYSVLYILVHLSVCVKILVGISLKISYLINIRNYLFGWIFQKFHLSHRFRDFLVFRNIYLRFSCQASLRRHSEEWSVGPTCEVHGPDILLVCDVIYEYVSRFSSAVHGNSLLLRYPDICPDWQMIGGFHKFIAISIDSAHWVSMSVGCYVVQP